MGFGIGFEFGTQKIMAGEEVGRVVLNDVEVNKLAD